MLREYWEKVEFHSMFSLVQPGERAPSKEVHIPIQIWPPSFLGKWHNLFRYRRRCVGPLPSFCPFPQVTVVTDCIFLMGPWPLVDLELAFALHDSSGFTILLVIMLMNSVGWNSTIQFAVNKIVKIPTTTVLKGKTNPKSTSGRGKRGNGWRAREAHGNPLNGTHDMDSEWSLSASRCFSNLGFLASSYSSIHHHKSGHALISRCIWCTAFFQC